MRPPASSAPPVRGGVDAASEPAGDDDTGRGQLAADRGRHLAALPRRGAGPDHRHRRGAWRAASLAAQPQHQGRVENRGQQRRIRRGAGQRRLPAAAAAVTSRLASPRRRPASAAASRRSPAQRQAQSRNGSPAKRGGRSSISGMGRWSRGGRARRAGGGGEASRRQCDGVEVGHGASGTQRGGDPTRAVDPVAGDLGAFDYRPDAALRQAVDDARSGLARGWSGGIVTSRPMIKTLVVLTLLSALAAAPAYADARGDARKQVEFGITVAQTWAVAGGDLPVGARHRDRPDATRRPTTTWASPTSSSGNLDKARARPTSRRWSSSRRTSHSTELRSVQGNQ